MRELFEFNKSENLQLEDSEYVFKANEDLSIQVCDGSEYGGATTYNVNRLVWIDDGNNFASEDFGNLKLDDAMKKCLSYINREALIISSQNLMIKKVL